MEKKTNTSVQSKSKRSFFVALSAFVFLLSAFIIPVAGFEAHVINIVAKIEPPKTMCDALSFGYWGRHEGCFNGDGESVWTPDINALSSGYSGVFSAYTGGEMCGALHMPLCPSGNTVPAALCRAKTHLLADELNVVAGNLDLLALIACADDGASAFNTFSLTENSTIDEALMALEEAIANPLSSKYTLKDAAYVAERIYSFYEDENPIAPQCVYHLNGTCYVEGNGATTYVEDTRDDDSGTEEIRAVETISETNESVGEEGTLPTEDDNEEAGDDLDENNNETEESLVEDSTLPTEADDENVSQNADEDNGEIQEIPVVETINEGVGDENVSEEVGSDTAESVPAPEVPEVPTGGDAETAS